MKVFEAVTLAFPEVYDPIWSERVRQFGAGVETFRKQVRNRYPAEVQDLETAVGGT
jgi:hypothetical protein